MKVVVAAVVFFISVTSYASLNNGPYRETKVSGGLMKPAHVNFDEKNLAKLKVPAGFKLNLFAKGTGHTRMMVAGPDGLIYFSDPEAGEIYSLKESADGKGENKTVVVSGIDKVNGMILHDSKLYFVAVKTIYALDLKDPKAKPQIIDDHFPDGGQHHNRVIHEGPDGYLYVSVGSTCNACADANKENATMQRMKFDGTDRSEFAKGLRDTMGFDWSPETHELYGADHGVDWRGDKIPPEEFNLIVKGGNYGWPFCWGDKKPDPNLIDEPKGSTKEKYCPTTQAPALTFDAHSAPIDLKFYNGESFPAQYKTSAFVSMHGSWNRRPPSGYSVQRVIFKDGKPSQVEPFLTGFLSSDGHSAVGRPAGLLIDSSGALLVSDDESGAIYRISYVGKVAH